MRKILPYETIKSLIQKGGFGTYLLYIVPGDQKIAGSHLMADADADARMNSDALVVDLDDKINEFRNGLYKIVLKKSNKTRSEGEVTYYFEVRDFKEDYTGQQREQQMQQIPVQLAGLSGDRVEELVKERVAQLLSAREAEWQKQREVDELKREILELKRRKPATRKKENPMRELMGMGLVAGSAFITEQWPNTKPIVEKALDALNGMGGGEDEEDEEDEGSTFSRPE
jgi:hypothetical protein